MHDPKFVSFAEGNAFSHETRTFGHPSSSSTWCGVPLVGIYFPAKDGAPSCPYCDVAKQVDAGDMAPVTKHLGIGDRFRWRELFNEMQGGPELLETPEMKLVCGIIAKQGLSIERAATELREFRQQTKWHQQRLEDLETSVRLANAFQAAGLETVADVLKLGKEGFLKLPGVAGRSWGEWQVIVGELTTGDQP